MPTYCYLRPDNKIEEVFMSIVEKERREGKGGVIVLDDGTKAVRSLIAEQRGARDVSDSAYPIASKAAAVHPDQIAEATEHAKHRGVPTNFDRMGHPIFESAVHQKRYCKTRQMANLDTYY